MHKSKDGKIYASLTEVKNKTGDIFAVVDEFGEISLTSYNKIRYKIVKVDINSVLSFDEEKEIKPKKIRVESAIVEITKNDKLNEENKLNIEIENEQIAEIQEKEPEDAIVTNNLFSSIIDITSWDRNNKVEREFTKKSMNPLISN